jgi:large subunit ribosomal protein L13
MTKYTYTIDAAGKTLGRVASEAAKALMGKMLADYTPHVQSDVKVSVVNVGKLYTRERKRKSKMFITFSGFPGGMKRESLASLNARRPSEALKRAVRRMLPRNTMLVARLKNLTITQ